jgi:predicted nucleic acid-binding protein
MRKLRPWNCSRAFSTFRSPWPIARLAGELKRDYSRKGVTLATTDVTIAAVALYHRLTLITDNLKHYPMKDLDMYPLPKGSG